MVLSLINNIAFLIALVAVGQLVISHFFNNPRNRQVLLGLLFGGVAILVMLNPVTFAPGIIFDGRSIVLAVVGVVGGAAAALIAAVMAAIYRYQLGGVGATLGVVVVLLSALLGVLARQWLLRLGQPPKPIHYLALGVVVQLMQLTALTQAPGRAGFAFIEQVWWVILLIYPLATMLLCVIFRNHEQQLIDQQALTSAQEAVAAAETASRDRFHAYFDHSIIGLAITSPAKGWLEVNDALCATLGYTRDELTRMTWTELTYPEDLAPDLAQFNRMLSGEINSYTLDKRFVHKDGHLVDTRLAVSIVRKPDGSVDYVVAMVDDVSERKRAEEIALEALRRVDRLAQHVPGMLYQYHRRPDGTAYMPYSSAGIKDIFGVTPDEVSQDVNYLFSIIHPDDRQKAWESVQASAQTLSDWHLEFRVNLPDGRTIWVEGEASPEVAPDGDVLWHGHNRDITERKLAAETLLETQVMLAQTEEIGKIGGWEFDINTLQQTWTKAVYAIHEVDFTGQPTVEQGISFYTPESRPIIEQAVQRAIEHGEPFDLELEIITAKGNLRAVHSIGRHDPVRGKIVGFFQDITERKQAEAAINERNNRLTAVMENLNEGLIMADHSGFVSYWNPMAMAINGFASMDDCRRPLAEFAKMFEFRLLNADRPVPIEDWPMSRVLRGDRLLDWEVRLRRLDQGWEKIVSYSGWLINSTDSETLGFLSIIDITERKRAEEGLQQAASVFGHTREGITITGKDGTILNVNDAFTRITGYSRVDAIGQNPRLLSSGRQSAEFYKEMWDALIEQGHWSGEIWNRRKDGEVYAELLTISAIRDGLGVTQQYVALFSDISAIKAHQRQLEHMAHFDALTSLPNRVLLVDRLHQAMAQAQRRQQHLVVAYLDLDGFKAINDQHGHDAGDQVLIILAKRLKEALREGDSLARIGGDEFVAVLTDLEDTSASLPLIQRLQAAAALPVELGELSLSLSASLGVTFYPQAQDIDADQLLRQADQAMYQAKVAGKNRYCVFDAAQDSNVRKQHESLERIRLALERQEFVLYYQPKVNMRTGKVIGAEALIRWQHPEDGLLAPATFLPTIEGHPLAVDVGEWVIDTAMRQMEVWHAAGLDLPVSVNIGARQLLQDDFVERLQLILAQHPQVNPGCVELEVLETSALADVAQASQVIEDCAKIGMRFALDDFGTGYSSLTYLKRLRVTQLKIDQSFVRDMLNDPDDLAILQGIIGLAAAFDREVIAEGVETVAHGTALLQLGCELAQGYGIARPMPPDQLPAWAATWQPDPAWGGVMHSGEAPRSTGE